MPAELFRDIRRNKTVFHRGVKHLALYDESVFVSYIDAPTVADLASMQLQVPMKRLAHRVCGSRR